MRAQTVAAFALGFVFGGLCLAVALWSTGALRPKSRGWAPAPPAIVLPSPGLPDLSRAPQPAQAPMVLPPEPAPARGEANRVAAGLHLSMPIDGVDPNTLADTFRDARDGHEHEALDIPAPRGTPVHAVAEGNVAKLFESKAGGITVYQFDDSRTWCFYYAHLDHYARGLREAALLRPGDILGYVGTTGDAPPDAPHLHFAVFKLGPEKQWWKGTAIDPLPLLK